MKSDGPVRRDEQLQKQARLLVSRFMELPQEIRDMVYDHLWKQCLCLIVPINGRDAYVYYEGPSIRASKMGWSRLPLWLLTNKAVFHEGLQQLYLRAEWWIMSRSMISHWNKPSPLVNFSHATRIAFLCVRPEVKPFLEPDEKLVLGHSASEMISETLRLIRQDGNRSLKSLSLVFFYLKRQDWPKQHNWNRTKLDLSELTKQDLSLDRFGVSIWRPDGKDNDETYDAGLISMFKEEVARIGALLMGEGGHETFREKDPEDRPYSWHNLPPLEISYSKSR